MTVEHCPRLPLVLGVVGHRDLRDSAVHRLEQLVSEVISTLKRTCFDDEDDCKPLVLLSSLAEGADTLVARVALRHGATLIVPLPMPSDEYRKDFVQGIRPGAAEEFDKYLGMASAAPVMPLARGNSEELVRTDSAARALQYQAAGIFVVRHCHVLLVLWDGTESERTGGTAEMVAFKRHGIPFRVTGSARSGLDSPEIGPVVHIRAPREGGVADLTPRIEDWELATRIRKRSARAFLTGAVGFAKSLAFVRAPAGQPSSYDELAMRWDDFFFVSRIIQGFNADARKLEKSPVGQSELRASIESLFQSDEPSVLDRAHSIVPRWSHLFATADVLAQRRRSRFVWDWRIILGGSFVAFLSLTFSSHFHIEAFRPIYIVALASTIAYALYARSRKHQERFFDYRALAETMRVAVFWKLLGIGPKYQDGKLSSDRYSTARENPLDGIADAYPIRQSDDLAWVKISLTSIEATDLPADRPLISDPAHDVARKCWVHGQSKYFDQQSVRQDRLARSLENWAFLLVVIGACASLLSWAMEYRSTTSTTELFLVSSVLPGLAVILAGYSDRLGFRPQAQQYDRMRGLFRRAYELLPERVTDANRDRVHGLYVELGAEAMKENADWVFMYRERPIKALSSAG